MSHWLSHWSLKRDPFDPRRSAFVTTPGHAEALARLVHTIETVGRSARLVGATGSGKSRVMARAMEATRNPLRRFARISGPIDGADLFGRLAVELGARGAPSDSRAVAWRALAEAARLCRWQGLHLLLVVDDCQGLTTSSDLMDLQRLDELDPDPSTRLTVLRLSRPSELADSDWSLSVRLDPLTRSETATYVTTKLEAAGRSDPTFTPRAIARLQAASAGIPRGIDRLASLALIASACRGLEMVSPDVIDEAAAECPSLVPATVDFPSN